MCRVQKSQTQAVHIKLAMSRQVAPWYPSSQNHKKRDNGAHTHLGKAAQEFTLGITMNNTQARLIEKTPSIYIQDTVRVNDRNSSTISIATLHRHTMQHVVKLLTYFRSPNIRLQLVRRSKHNVYTIVGGVYVFRTLSRSHKTTLATSLEVVSVASGVKFLYMCNMH